MTLEHLSIADYIFECSGGRQPSGDESFLQKGEHITKVAGLYA